MRKMMYRLSLLISFLYGFVILMIFDMVNRKPYFNPVFRYPTQKGIFIGGISVILYILLMVIFYLISKAGISKFILMNILVLTIGVIIFRFMGVNFFIDTDTGP